MGLKYLKCTKWNLKPLIKGPNNEDPTADREGTSEGAVYSIDGEKYPAQNVSGRVLKKVMPVYC